MATHILVIEDDESILDLFRALLEKDGFVISTARNAFQNVRDIEAIAPDLIILDIMFGLHFVAKAQDVSSHRADSDYHLLSGRLCVTRTRRHLATKGHSVDL